MRGADAAIEALRRYDELDARLDRVLAGAQSDRADCETWIPWVEYAFDAVEQARRAFGRAVYDRGLDRVADAELYEAHVMTRGGLEAFRQWVTS